MLVNCVAYEAGRKLADIDKREISEYLKRPDAFVWVALRDPTEAECEASGGHRERVPHQYVTAGRCGIL